MEVVCVTGASGFIGSWVVRFLLQRGYHVRGTVQNIENERETKHLMSLEGAEENLELFQIDLLDFDTLARAIGQSNGVFHLASPCSLDPCKDPQAELIDPAVQGTINVLKASHAAGVKKVVVTSSISAMFPNPRLPPGTPVDENSWTDIEYCKGREGLVTNRSCLGLVLYMSKMLRELKFCSMNPRMPKADIYALKKSLISVILLKKLANCTHTSMCISLRKTLIRILCVW